MSDTRTLRDLSVADSSASEQGEEQPRRRFVPPNPWNPHTRKIILACGIVVVPMIAFTVIFVAIVFAKRISDSPCPYPEMCPGPDLLNNTGKAVYYVDYPAARLAFISSWSSTISFSLISILMTIFTYSIAARLLRLSAEQHGHPALPSPYQTSVLMRVLNAEMLALWDLGVAGIKAVFWKREKSEERNEENRTPDMVKTSIWIFVLCVLSSILIQVADSYLHIVTDAVELIRVETQPAEAFALSRGIAPWCFNTNETRGTQRNMNFWGCGMQYNIESGYVATANQTMFNYIDSRPLTDYAMNYTDKDGTQYTIVGPTEIEPNTDWKGVSFATSVQCKAVEKRNCEWNPHINESNYVGDLEWFNCTKERSGMDAAGWLVNFMHQTRYTQFHKYFYEEPPFNNSMLLNWDAVENNAPNVTDAEANGVFNNPWHFQASANVIMDELPEHFKNDPRMWVRTGPQYTFILDCSATVYDVEYTALGNRIIELNTTISNGTTAGIASMVGIGGYHLITNARDNACKEANTAMESVDAFINRYELAMSKVYSMPLAVQTTSRPAELVQHRVTRVVTKLPYAALWLLVLANLLFAGLALILGILALLCASEDVHQVHTRLSIAGLAAALFEKGHSENHVREDTDLFSENLSNPTSPTSIKKVGVRRTDTGGSAWTLNGDEVGVRPGAIKRVDTGLTLTEVRSLKSMKSGQTLRGVEEHEKMGIESIDEKVVDEKDRSGTGSTQPTSSRA
ncbi:hypothetical protein P154DRAFT_623765 [Amniculicola lignicola CBS 123094]|uniref:Uncharacterized protein n=1 Tax=Amniculicola lignicola CBS 123094 TaxID=1392246 RepID=A0A6A5WDF6_9PLEO|nr:hypothetical protein P154DRAFT_623765 [Amniculicola lignicola CBS 123094]